MPVGGERAGAAVGDRLGQAPDGERGRRGGARSRLHHGQAPALGGRGGQVDPGALEELALALLADVPVHPYPVFEPTPLDLGLEVGPVVALAGDVEYRVRHPLQHVEQQLDPLVLLQPAEVQQRRQQYGTG